MRFLKRRGHAVKPAVKNDGVIVFQTSAQNWRDRVRALKAAQDEQVKGETGLHKQERS